MSDASQASASVALRWGVPLGLVLLCVAVYSNALGGGFVLDSRQLILRDPRAHAWSAENLRLILQHSYWWPYGESGLYRPLTTLSYLVDYAVLGHGDRPFGYHLFNVAVHAVNVLLVWRVLLRVGAERWSATVSAALWAVLPLSTEAVTNLVGRADLLATTGALAALWLWLEPADTPGARTSDPPTARTAVRTVLVVLCLALGTLAKESAIAMLGVLVVAELCWWRGRRSVVRLTMLAVSSSIVLGTWLWQRSAVLAAGGVAEFPYTDNPLVGTGVWQAKLTAVQVMFRYLALIAWPLHLSADYSYAQILPAAGTTAEWVGAGLLLFALVAGLWQLRERRDALFFAALAGITFLPASNLLFATGTIMGERLVYLPAAGICALLALAGASLSSAWPRTRAAATGVAVLLVLAWGGRTFARNPDWTSDVTLWRATVRTAPASAKAHRALAEALYDADPTHANLDEVMASADRAAALLEAVPDEQNTYQTFRQAGAYYLDKANQVVARSQGSTDPELRRLYSRGLNLLDRAVLIARAGAARVPNGSKEPEADAQRLRAVAILGLGNPTLGLVAARRSRELSPLHPLGYQMSAQALLDMKRADEAVMTLLVGSIVSGDPGLGRDAMSLYASGADPEGCAVVGQGASAALNPQCATVVRHSCIASAAAYQIFTKAGQAARGEQVKNAALAQFACPTDLMDRPNSLVP